MLSELQFIGCWGASGRKALAGQAAPAPTPGQPHRRLPPPHKLLLPLDARDGAGLLLAVAAVFVAASSGLGGGALLVPIYLLVLAFPAGKAVALSNATIVGESVGNRSSLQECSSAAQHCLHTAQ